MKICNAISSVMFFAHELVEASAHAGKFTTYYCSHQNTKKMLLRNLASITARTRALRGVRVSGIWPARLSLSS
jgi:hypothetical protein